MSASRPSAAGQALRWATISAARQRRAGGAVAGERRGHRLRALSRLASCSRELHPAPRLVQTCGSTPRPWIGQPRRRQHAAPGDEQLAAIRQRRRSSAPGPCRASRCRPRRRGPGRPAPPARISAALAERPSTSTTTGMPLTTSPSLGRPRVLGLRVAAGGGRDHAGVEQQVGRGHRLPQQAAAVAAQVDERCPRGAAGAANCAVQLAGEALVGVAAEPGDPHQEPRRRRGWRTPSPAAARRAPARTVRSRPSRLRTVSATSVPSGPGNPALHGVEVLALRWAGRRRLTIWSPARMPASAAGPSPLTLCTTKTAPTRTTRDPGAGLAGAAGAVLVGGLGRDVARIGVEMVEQLVEEAGDDGLAALLPRSPARRPRPRPDRSAASVPQPPASSSAGAARWNRTRRRGVRMTRAVGELGVSAGRAW